MVNIEKTNETESRIREKLIEREKEKRNHDPQTYGVRCRAYPVETLEKLQGEQMRQLNRYPRIKGNRMRMLHIYILPLLYINSVRCLVKLLYARRIYQQLYTL